MKTTATFKKKNKITSSRDRPVNSRFFNYLNSELPMYFHIGALWLCLVILAIGACLSILHWRNYLRLRDEKVYLQQKKMELEEVQLVLKNIQENEMVFRGLLGSAEPAEVGTILGQGGVSATTLPSGVSQNLSSFGEIWSPARMHLASVLEQARSLQERVQELVEIISEQQDLMDRTPTILPVKAKHFWFSSRFGWRRSPFTGAREFHKGLDISGRKGSPIVAPAKGRVIGRGYDDYQGNYLQIDHGWGCITTFAHLLKFNVSLGQGVERGEVIAFMGSTGRSTNPHLHYQIEVNGEVVDPNNFIIITKDNMPLELLVKTDVMRKLNE
jgi:murein DD-endopeptidase MepM/ murein hydrolase activator NlpD